ncbi:MAG: DMT family transporter [Bacillota bacterium]
MVIFYYLLMCIIFGTTFLAIKVAVIADAPPFFSAGIRFFAAGSLIFIWMIVKKKATFLLLWRKEPLLTGTGLTFSTFGALYWAEQHIASGVAAVLSATAPIMIILLQAIFHRQKISVKSLCGCLIGVAGVALLVLPSMPLEVSLLWLLGCVMILIGEIGYSSGTLYARHVIRRFEHTSPIALNAVQMMYGGAMLLLLSLFTERIRLDSILTVNALGSLLYLTIVGSMLGHSIYYWLVAKTNPVFPATWLYISPIIALFLGALLYDETVSRTMLAGVAAILSGIILVNIETLRPLFRKKTIVRSGSS